MNKFTWKCSVCNEVFQGELPPDVCPICGANSSAFIKIEQEIESNISSNERYVIIGGGIAGLECAKTIRKKNNTCSITIICKEKYLPYNRPALSDVLEEELTLDSITLKDENWFKENSITINNSSAQYIDRYGKMVKLQNEEFISYDKLAIATGAVAFCPFTFDEKSIPVYTLRQYDDVLKIKDKIISSKKAVIVGGGILGLEAAVALRANNLGVTVVELAPYIMSVQADKFASDFIERKLSEYGIKFKTDISVKSVCSDGIILSDGQKIESDFVIVSAGIRCETSLAKNSGLNVNRGIIIDNKMKTNDASIYAMGDCAEYNGKVLGLWSTATMQGKIAGASMVGEDVEYKPTVPATVFSGASITFFSAGNICVNDSKEICYHDKLNNIYKNLIYNQDDLIEGVVLLGDTSASAKAMNALNKRLLKPYTFDLL